MQGRRRMQKITFPRFTQLSMILSVSIGSFGVANTAHAIEQLVPHNNQKPNVISKSQALRSQLDGRVQEPVHVWPLPKPKKNSEFSASLNANSALSTETPLIHDGDSKAKMSIGYEFGTNRVHANIKANVFSDTTSFSNPEDENINLDGSSAGFYLGNWDFWAGAVDRWWGPTWQSPLIVSNNARPLPTLNIDRIESTAFKTPLLSWIGSWRINTFLGQLESERHIPDAYLWGMRASAIPFEGFEIGFNRVAMFGGEGRDVSPRVLFNVIRGHDNEADQPGNQLGSIDLSYRFAQSHQDYNSGHEFYLELAGEDEAHAFPSKKFGTLGYTGFLSSKHSTSSLHYVLEYTNTMSGGFGLETDEIADVTYDHSIYQTGYTYYNQVMGSPLGGDTEAFLIGAWVDKSTQSRFVQTPAHNFGGWLTRKHTINSDAYHELTVWYEKGFNQFTFKLAGSLADENLYFSAPSSQGKKYAMNISVNWLTL